MSFKKRGAATTKLPTGSRLSPYNGSLLVSTGVPSLDDVFGGGLPVGTVLLIEQDQFTDYARTLLKYWTTQGLVANNETVVVSDDNAEEYVKNLPWLAGDASVTVDSKETKAEDMTIAWRYKNLKQLDSIASTTSTYCSTFDLTKKVPSDIVDSAKIHQITITPEYTSSEDEIMNFLRPILEKYSSRITATDRQILRISIDGIASFKLLHSLRATLRFSFASAVITYPAYLYSPSTVASIQHMADAVVAIDSFAGLDNSSPLAPYFDDYHGFFRVVKLPTVNSLIPASTKLSVLSGHGAALGFKLQRKRFTIEKVHLPIEGGTSERRVVHDQGPRKITASVGIDKPATTADPMDF